MSTLTSNNSSPTAPPSIDLKDIYILYYREGVHVHLTKFFLFKGPLQKALERAKKHCELMNYRCLFVRPFLSDLIDEEKKRFASAHSSEEMASFIPEPLST